MIEYKVLGAVDGGRKLRVSFTNPYRTPSRENKEEFKDHVRDINVQFNGTVYDKAATDSVIEQQAYAVANKMKLAYENSVVKGAKLDPILDEYELIEEYNGEEKRTND